MFNQCSNVSIETQYKIIHFLTKIDAGLVCKFEPVFRYSKSTPQTQLLQELFTGFQDHRAQLKLAKSIRI
jgi:hypothetical protein